MAETADLVKGLNRRIYTAEVDVRDYDALKAAVDCGVEQLGRLDIIVANAGIGNGGNTLDKTSEIDWQEMMDMNLSGVWKTVKAGVPHLIAGGHGGSIILTSSVGGLKAYPHMRPLRRRQARRGGPDADVRSGARAAIHPGQLRAPTNVNTPMLMNDGTNKLFRPDLKIPEPTTSHGCQIIHTLPIPWVEPKDISNAVLFFASDESRYVTGVPLPVDAGGSSSSTFCRETQNLLISFGNGGFCVCSREGLPLHSHGEYGRRRPPTAGRRRPNGAR